MALQNLQSSCGTNLFVRLTQEDGNAAVAWQETYPDMHLLVNVLNGHHAAFAMQCIICGVLNASLPAGQV